jgi:hypothetical protein
MSATFYNLLCEIRDEIQDAAWRASPVLTFDCALGTM